MVRGKENSNSISHLIYLIKINCQQNGLVETTLRTNKVYTVYYIFWSKFLVVELGPYMTILILNIRIIQKIYKSNKFRRKFTVRVFLFCLRVLSFFVIILLFCHTDRSHLSRDIQESRKK